MAYQSELKDRGRLCCSNSLISILPLLLQLIVTTEKLRGKKNGTELGKNNDKMEIKFEIIKELECRSLLW